MLAGRIEGLIPDATGVLSVIIMCCAFLLSFANLQAVAIEAGIFSWLSWAWPVCIDALLIAGSLMILRSSLRQESTRFGWFVVIVFTGVSIAFNIVHSSGDIVSQAAHAVPPVTLMVSIEMFTKIVRSDLNQAADGTSNEHVTSGHVLVQDVTLPDQKRKVTDEAVLQFFSSNSQASYIEAAESLQVARQTISRKVSRLIDEGKLIREGKDLIVTGPFAWAPEVA
jgi:hypothetical protein